MFLTKTKMLGDKVISIVGTGYVGLTTAAILSNVGYKVYTIDVDENKINTIKSGKSYFYEAGLDEMVKRGIESGNLIPTTNYFEAIPFSDICFICVGTPSNYDGSVDLKYIFEANKSIVTNASRDLIIVQKSTVPVGTGKRVTELISRLNKNNFKIDLVSCPEFLREGSAVFDTVFFDRLVVGGDSLVCTEIIDIYRHVYEFSKTLNQNGFNDYAFLNVNPKYVDKLDTFENRVIRTNIESAELLKVTANSFLALKISFANTISRICDKTGAITSDVMDGIGLDPRIGRAFLYQGLGYGGGCFPKDVNGMINTANFLGVEFGILDQVEKVNNTQIYFVLSKLKEILCDNFIGKKVAFLGLSFKAGTSDCRRSQSFALLDKILGEGMIARVYDPQAMEESKKILQHENLTYCENMNDVFDDADIIVLATEWKEFINFDYSTIKNKLNDFNFFDGRSVLNPEKMKWLGFKYYSL